MKGSNTMKKFLTASLITLVSLLVVCIVLYNVAVMIYSGSFNYRCTTSEDDAFSMEDFPELTSERHTFKTMQGHTLGGYLYESADETVEEKAVIVFAHGMGAGGQVGYMDIFNFMAQNGFYVFAYDATANDESEGEVMGGLPQGYIDLDYAIDYAQTIGEINELPFLLMGYSWGAMSVTNVLNYHPEVKGVVAMAGWNKSMDMIDYVGCGMVGPVAKLLLPFASVYEYVQYGDYAFSTSMKGFENSDCPVFIVHGAEDDTIPISYGLDYYKAVYENDDRFTFKTYDDRDHIVMRDADGNHDLALMAEVVEFFNNVIK